MPNKTYACLRNALAGTGISLPPMAPLTAGELTPESFLDATIEFWQTSAGRNLTHEDAREIVENMTGFFAVLRQWRDAERP
jgi:hypothetical protein